MKTPSLPAVVAVMAASLPLTAEEPTDATFHYDTHRHLIKRSGDTIVSEGHGDNFCLTWTANDSLYTYQDDGFGWISRSERPQRAAGSDPNKGIE